jgi:hypothetical protein
MSCPKCGTSQPTSDVCVNCGIVFAKFTARKPDERTKSEDPKPTTTDEKAIEIKNDIKPSLQPKMKTRIRKLLSSFLVFCLVMWGIMSIVGFCSGETVMGVVFLIPILVFVSEKVISKSEKLKNLVMAGGRALFIVLGILIVVGFIAMLIDNGKKGLKELKVDIKVKERGYYDACQEALKSGKSNGVRLKAPSTAKFQPFSEIKDNIVTDSGMVALYFYVDSQNAFGAMLREDCKCVVNGSTGTVISVR